MSEAATPPVQPGATPPAAPGATPAAGTEMLTLSKVEVEQLRRDAARASSNQRKADLYDRTVGGRGTSHFKPTAPATPPTQEELKENAVAEDRKAEQGLMRLALDPAYRSALDSDPTLRDLLSKNPLAVLPILAPDALDAEDAVGLVREALSKRSAPPASPATPPATPPAPPAPPAGGINPTATVPDEEYEAARKLPKTENAIAGMIRASAKRMGKK